MAQRRDRGRRPRDQGGRPKRQHPRRDDRRHRGPPRGPSRGPSRKPPRRSKGPAPKREMVAKGKATELGVDGRLRVEMEPLSLEVAADLTRGKGALVLTPRGDRLGQVETVVGNLKDPVAVVRVFPDMRKEASSVIGRELFMG